MQLIRHYFGEAGLRLWSVSSEAAESSKISFADGFVPELFGRNKALAIAAAALIIAEAHRDDVLMLVRAADHRIPDKTAFAQTVARATVIAQQGKLVTFGIKLEGLEIGYGCIDADVSQPNRTDAGVIGYSVRRFVEMSNLEIAKE